MDLCLSIRVYKAYHISMYVRLKTDGLSGLINVYRETRDLIILPLHLHFIYTLYNNIEVLDIEQTIVEYISYTLYNNRGIRYRANYSWVNTFHTHFTTIEVLVIEQTIVE